VAQSLNRVNFNTEGLATQGYQVTIRPDPEALPPFAKDFQVEILGK
jgi:hypothetical protein